MVKKAMEKWNRSRPRDRLEGFRDGRSIEEERERRWKERGMLSFMFYDKITHGLFQTDLQCSNLFRMFLC